jgi:UDP-glucose 4-epimerase
MNILVTGANGFVGQHLCKILNQRGMSPSALLRKRSPALNVKKQFVVEDFLKNSEWKEILQGIDVVIHTAGLAHVTGRPDEDYYAINTHTTEKLALECAKLGVKRFVYISSIYAIFGGHSNPCVLTLDSPCTPETPYGKSKLLAEEKLRTIEKKTGLEIVIVRPPLVYGPNALGNIRMLARAIKKGIPFPFARVKNKRDMVYVENLADALMTCAIHPAAKGNTFFVSDGQPLSIVDLIQGLAQGMDKKARFFYLPESVVRLPLKMLKKEEMLEKITGSLQVDIREIHEILGWNPFVSSTEGLEKTGHSFR